MTDRPILFSAPMVRALLEGRKTQTRRLMPFQTELRQAYSPIVFGARILNYAAEEVISEARFFAGDRLWVRESWRTLHKDDVLAPRHLADDRSKITFEADPENRNPLWAFGRLRPGIHMPRWASRLTLFVTDVRIERLQDISEEDARAEGIADGGCLNCGQSEPCGCSNPKPDARDAFAHLWGQINGPDAWAANPWVAAISFTVHRENIDALGVAA